MPKKTAEEEIRDHLQDPEAKAYISKRQAEIDLAVKIKMHRERLGLSQRELAEKMGVPQPTITRMESGDSGINTSTLEKFCQVTGLEIDLVPDKNERSVIEVSEYIMLRCSQILGENYDITILKLLKLLYYTQAKFLVSFGRPFFSHQFESWDKGPVHKEAYSYYANVNEPARILLPKTKDFTLNKDEKDTVDYILFEYDKGLAYQSAYQLVEKTHIELPWINAHKNGNNTLIVVDVMREYYRGRL
ncbi:MAG: helix-turn-helix domain-containing protein [bacterium]